MQLVPGQRFEPVLDEEISSSFVHGDDFDCERSDHIRGVMGFAQRIEEEMFSEALTLRRPIDREPRQMNHRHRVLWKTFRLLPWKVGALDGLGLSLTARILADRHPRRDPTGGGSSQSHDT